MNTFETNMRDGTNAASGDAPKNKVYYIADIEGTIASYNPNYILRKLPGEDPYKMALPSAAGTLALTSDIGAVSGEIYEEINEIKNNYNELRTDTDEISGKVDALEDIVSGTDVAHLGGTETFTGDKTFSKSILVGGDDAGLSVTYAGFVRNVDGAEYTYDLPLKAGQLALDSDLSDYRAASAQDSIDAAQDAAIAAKYTKPSGGIPASDLASGVIPAVPVKSVKRNGMTIAPDAQGAVDVEVPLSFDRIVSPDASTILSLRTASRGATLSMTRRTRTIGNGFSADRHIENLFAGVAHIEVDITTSLASYSGTMRLASRTANKTIYHPVVLSDIYPRIISLGILSDDSTAEVAIQRSKGSPAIIGQFRGLTLQTYGDPFATPVATLRDIPPPTDLSDDTPLAPSATPSHGTSTTASRSDHVHPVDTSRMPADATGEDIAISSDSGATIASEIETITNAVISNASAVTAINGKIPSAATAANQLADKAFVTDSITSGTAVFRGSFATKADLDAVQWQTTDPSGANFVSNNDYVVVLDDETHSDECWRYLYVVSSGSGSWTPQYRINESPLTQAQQDALNSGVTSAVVSHAESALQPLSPVSGGRIVVSNQDGGIEESSSLIGEFVDWTAAEEQFAKKSELGTAASKDVPGSGDATATQVVMGNDTRLSDARTPKFHTHKLEYSDSIYTDQPEGTMFKANNKGEVVKAVAGTDYVAPSGLANYVQKSQTAGLLKNDGTVDTNQYLTQHQDISGKLDVTQRNLLVYTTGTTLALGTAVYRSSLNSDGTFPTITDSGILTAAAYYMFELELTVPSTVPSTITGPSGWTWIDGHGLPDPADLSGGETIYISVRLDCTARTFLASVWRVA